MAGTMDILIREMTIADYDQVYGLWTEIKGFGIRSIDDSREGVERFLGRNPTTSVVAVQNGHIIGNILSRNPSTRMEMIPGRPTGKTKQKNMENSLHPSQRLS